MEKITLNMNNTPVTQPESLRTYEIPINITRKAFEGLRRQGMSFHQAVCEIVDDAIAASKGQAHVSRMKPERGASIHAGTRATISKSAVRSIRA